MSSGLFKYITFEILGYKYEFHLTNAHTNIH